MYRKAMGVLAVCLLCLTARAAAQAPGDVDHRPPPPAAETVTTFPRPTGACRAQPAVWVAYDKDTTIFLFGTIHVRRPGAPLGGPVAEWALRQSRIVWMETDLSETPPPELLQSRGIDRAHRLSANPDINASNQERIRAAAATMGMPYDDLDVMQPWLAGVTLSLTPILRAGYDPEAGVDRVVNDYARKHGKVMRSFETAQEQFGFLASLSRPLQLDLLYQGLDELDKGADALHELESDWEVGRDSELQRTLVDDVRAASSELNEVMLTKRNTRWANTIEQELEESTGTEFVAVGIAHLLGRDGVPEQLRRLGHTVERLTPDPDSPDVCG